MINISKQVWTVGSTVKAGDLFYKFIPHNGLTKIDPADAN